MTDRLKGCVVLFDKDIRDDDCQPLIDAIRMLKHVKAVTPNLAGPDDWMCRERVRRELQEKLWSVFEEPKP